MSSSEDAVKKSDHVLLGGGNQEPDQTLNLQSTTCCIPDDCLNKTKDTEVVVLDDDDDLPAVFNDNTEEHDQILAVCQSFCVTDKSALPADNFEGLDNELDMDIDQLIDYDSTFLDDWVSEYTLQEDGAFVLPTSFDERYICQL
ncbi:unnamed protein product [Arabis nemorensis]|uniref:Uncharacterized protein n=1 Tax=Arabis nemorensis TaxID=586526 RepID=A0A565AWN2_9BRAS|nr:unnamed protein product [Arabis nemorensis]